MSALNPRINAQNDAEFLMPAIPLATLKRNSRSRFSWPQFPKQTRGEKIYDDIINEQYECLICFQNIASNAQMWSCRECHHVYHFDCIKEWAKGNDFQCPTCKTAQKKSEIHTATCWCLSRTHRDLDALGNTCGGLCNRMMVCESEGKKCRQRCSKLCHPGPCKQVICRADCPTKGQLNATLAIFNALEAEENTVNRVERSRVELDRAQAARDIRRIQRQSSPEANNDGPSPPSSNLKNVFPLVLSITVIQLVLVFWALLWINRRVYPLDHLHYTGRYRIVELCGIILAGCLLLGPVSAFLSLMLFGNLVKFLTHRFHESRILQSAVIAFAISLSIALIIYYPCLIFSAPVTIWNTNMKTSRQGFDMRVNLDEEYGESVSKVFVYGAGHPRVSRDLNNDVEGLRAIFDYIKGVNPFIFAGLIDDRADPLGKFHTFHRMEGILVEAQRAIDFDLKHNVWRIVNVSEPTASLTPEFVGNPIKNGSWTKTTNKDPHTRFPELNLVAPNFHYFTIKCQYEGFMTFFKTNNMTEKAILAQANERWSPWSNENVVMRTANHVDLPNIRDLEVLAKREDYKVGNKTMKGLGEDFVVPMGLIAILHHEKFVGKEFEWCYMF